MLRFVKFLSKGYGDDLQDQVNEWLTNNSTIEVVSTNIFTGSDRFSVAYMILYKQFDTSKLV